MLKRISIWKDIRGYAVVEATILFPVIFMIFFGLVILSMYLPTRSLLQRATQYTATAIATERSDSWLRFDVDTMSYYWAESRSELGNVYGAFLGSLTGNKKDDADTAKQTVKNIAGTSVVTLPGELSVEYGVVNYFIYKEVIVTAKQSIPSPINLSFVGFPESIDITVTSTAVVQNGDEFIRNMDLAVDFIDYLSEKYGFDEIFDKVAQVRDKFAEFMGV